MTQSLLDRNSGPYDYATASMEDRCSPRILLSIPAILRPSGVPGFDISVVDLSRAGFAADAVTGMQRGARCWLALPGLAPLQAEIVWNNGSRVGCAFTNLLNQSVLDAILDRFVPKSSFRLIEPSWRTD
jgi:hypothetical protein